MFLDIVSNKLFPSLIIKLITLGMILLTVIGFSLNIIHIVEDFYVYLVIISILSSYFITKFKIKNNIK